MARSKTEPLTAAQLERITRWHESVVHLTKPQLIQVTDKLFQELAAANARNAVAGAEVNETLAKLRAETEVRALRAELQALREQASPGPAAAPIAPVTLQLPDSPETRELVEKLAALTKQPEPPACECGEPATVHTCEEHGKPECPDCETALKCPHCSEPETPECENCSNEAKHVLCESCFNNETRADLFDELVELLEQPVQDDFDRRHRREEIGRVLEQAGARAIWPAHAQLAI